MQMLSFTRGEPIAIALDKDDKVVFTIHLTPDQTEPDIKCDNVLELIGSPDIDVIRSTNKIGIIEERMLRKAVRVGEKAREKLRLSPKLERCLEVLKENAQDKLKKEVDFSNDDDVVRVLPLIGGRPTSYDRSIAMIAPSEAGKSFLIKEICKFDKRKRPVVVFSKIEDDSSLRELKTMRTPVDKKARMIQIPLKTEENLLTLPSHKELSKCICVFDDLDSFDQDTAQFLRQYRDSCLEVGRHNEITTISTSHILNNYQKTRVMLNEAQYIVLYPASNKAHSIDFLRRRLGLSKPLSNYYIDKSMRAGRFMAIRVSAPNGIIHNKGVILI